ncbi:MAG: single-stranded DNA-binding protein [Candidatus Magasanikbacteria bacterium]|nr:single-stranded DNA-binding protein [Candidatus Magasanikbacteria bacterium]|tara:strand:+ start:1100 stop:1540 length:441 start_codon:yes stop_codon:yes gene_type:complete
MDLNRASILGRLTRDPEVRTTPNGRNVASFAVATGRIWTDQSGVKQERTEFHNCVLWGKLADIAGQYLSKGRRVYIEGRIETRSWDAQDGSKRYRTEIVVDNLIMLDGPKGSGVAPSQDNPPTPIDPGPQTPDVGTDEIKVEDIPF